MGACSTKLKYMDSEIDITVKDPFDLLELQADRKNLSRKQKRILDGKVKQYVAENGPLAPPKLVRQSGYLKQRD